jgi:hypothetical protein
MRSRERKVGTGGRYRGNLTSSRVRDNIMERGAIEPILDQTSRGLLRGVAAAKLVIWHRSL